MLDRIADRWENITLELSRDVEPFDVVDSIYSAQLYTFGLLWLSMIVS